MSTGPSTTDAELVAAAADGDRVAFAAIYDRYANRLHDYCVGMLRDRDAAADCVQDTFCTVATKLVQLRDGDKLRPWLYSIARNEALRHQRERRREEPTDMLPDLESTDNGPDVMAARNELADLVADAAGGLSERDRTILDLTYRHDLDGVELAEVLGVTKSNAGTLVHRMRDTVERTLGALLVARQVDGDPESCVELAAILEGWDGKFTVLVRKRVARHIESCEVCESSRRSMVTPVALLGGAPVFVPAPDWLRDKTLSAADLPSPVVDPPSGSGQPGGTASGGARHAASHAAVSHTAASSAGPRRRRQALIGTALVGLIAGAAVTIATLPRSGNVTPVVLTTPEATTTITTQSVPSAPAQFVPPPPQIPATTTVTSLPDVARTAPATTTPPMVAEIPPPVEEPTTTAVTTEVTQSFSPTVRSTPTEEEVETTEEITTEEVTTTKPPPSTTKTTRRPPTIGPVEPGTLTQTTTPPIIY